MMMRRRDLEIPSDKQRKKTTDNSWRWLRNGFFKKETASKLTAHEQA